MTGPRVLQLTQGKDLGHSPAWFLLSHFECVVSYNRKGLIADMGSADGTLTACSLQLLSQPLRDTF